MKHESGCVIPAKVTCAGDLTHTNIGTSRDMKNLRIVTAALLATFALSACDSGDDDSTTASVELREGVNITMRNTLEEGGPEGSFPSLFGAPDNAFDESATLSFAESEFPTALMQAGTPVGDIPGLYDIDFTSNQISFKVLPLADDPFWSGVAEVFGVFPQGKFDRYYFTFSEAHNIASGVSSNSSVGLRVDSDTVVVVEIGEGYDLSPGISWTIDLQ